LARVEYILTLNYDTIVGPGFVEPLIDAMENDAGIGMCTGKMLYPDGRINSAGICISRSKAAWGRGMFALDAFQFEIPEEVLSPCAGAALYRKKLLEEIGLLDVECHN
jgi:hypothetical protein